MSSAVPQSSSLPIWASETHLLSECSFVAGQIEQFFAECSPWRDQWHLDFPEHLSRLKLRNLRLLVAALESDAAFETVNEGKTIVFNVVAIKMIYDQICYDISIPEHEQKVSIRGAIALFILHELRHISQDLEEYASISELKTIGQKHIISHFDLLADVLAAKDYATFICWSNQDRASDLWIASFNTAMYHHVYYCLKSFDYPYASNHKMGRAIGLILMLVRSAILLEASPTTGQNQRRPLYCGIIVNPSDDYENASILWVDHGLALAKVIKSSESSWIKEASKLIEKKQIDDAVNVITKYLLEEPAFWAKSDSVGLNNTLLPKFS